MKLGLVSYLNARPLDFYFRVEKRNEIQLSEDTPASLFQRLSKGELDAALISSVECLRHRDLLAHCDRVGVCASERVLSIIYLRRKNHERGLPQMVYVDAGSRSSVALLDILLFKDTGLRVPLKPTPPGEIPGLLSEDTAGLLIGDDAMRFLEGDTGDFVVRDLARWWQERESLPFVFALWAYPRERPVPDSFFEDALDYGLKNLEKIAASAPYSNALPYLRDILHYRLSGADRRALERFELRLSELDS